MTTKPATTTNLRVLSSILDLYERPGADQSPTAQLTVGTEVIVLTMPDALGWTKLKRVGDGYVGWAFTDYLGPAIAPSERQGAYRVKPDALELRTGPGTEYPIIAAMPQDTLVTQLIDPCQGWAEVRDNSNGRVGWCAAEYLAAVPPAQAGTGPAVMPASAGSSERTPAPDSAKSTSAPATAGKRTQQGCCWQASPRAGAGGGSPLVFDVSHFQGEVDARSAYADGLRGMLHKATEGTDFVDPMYAFNRANARAAGFLWGAYHFGIGGNPQGQAEYFLRHAAPDGSTLLVLDLESNPQGASMSIDDARSFVTYLHNATGKWPGLYGGGYIRDQLGSARDPVLGNCWFWLAEYGDNPSVPPTWPCWTLWQYTDGTSGPEPHRVSGVNGGACDRDRFAGDAGELTQFWAACGV